MSLAEFNAAPRHNPLDVVEQLASGNDWSFERAGEDEITILITGRWSDYQVSFTWMGELGHCISPAPSTSRFRSGAAPKCSSSSRR
jgi:hypothetical protein